MYQHSPSIIKKDLVIYLDAGNEKSYSGSGTLWKNLSGNNRHFVWDAGPTFTNLGPRSYFSTSAAKAVSTSDSALFDITNTTGYTITYIAKTVTIAQNSAFKFYSTAASNNRAIFVHPSWDNSTVYFDQGGCCGSDTRTNVTLSSTSFTNFNIWTFRRETGSSTRTIFLNENIIATNTNSAANISIGGGFVYVGGGESTWDSNFSLFLTYSRGLSDEEVKKNVFTLRGRFGI